MQLRLAVSSHNFGRLSDVRGNELARHISVSGWDSCPCRMCAMTGPMIEMLLAEVDRLPYRQRTMLLAARAREWAGIGVLGPVLAQSARLLFIALGGWWLSMHGASAANFFALAAASMAVLGVLSAASVMLTRWGPKARPVAQARPALS